jgi:hypothetical protein
MLFVVKVLKKSIEGRGRLTKSNLAGVGGDSEGASDSSEEDSSEVSSSDSVGWSGIPLEGTASGVGEGMGLSESDQNDGGR